MASDEKQFLVSEGQNGWMNHARGLESLFERRGVDRMASLPSLIVLEKSRPSMIFAAIVLRENTITARPEWKVLPWSHYPDRETALKRLIDIMADCPKLFFLRARIEQSQTTLDVKALQTRSLENETLHVLHNLHHWEHEWGLSVNDTYIEVESPATTPVTLEPLGIPTPIWPTILRYKSPYHANTLTFYHGAVILVLRLLNGLKLSLQQDHETEAIHKQIHNAGVFICRSVDYHLDQTWSEMGSLDLLFPLRMAYEAVGKEEPAVSMWLKNVLDDISAGRCGLWKSARAVLAL